MFLERLERVPRRRVLAKGEDVARGVHQPRRLPVGQAREEPLARREEPIEVEGLVEEEERRHAHGIRRPLHVEPCAVRGRKHRGCHLI